MRKIIIASMAAAAFSLAACSEKTQDAASEAATSAADDAAAAGDAVAEGAADAASARLYAAGTSGAPADARPQRCRYAEGQSWPLGDERRLSGPCDARRA